MKRMFLALATVFAMTVACYASTFMWIQTNYVPTDHKSSKDTMVEIQMFSRMSDMECSGPYTVYLSYHATWFSNQHDGTAALSDIRMQPESIELQNAFSSAGIPYGIMHFTETYDEVTLSLTPAQHSEFGYAQLALYDRSGRREGAMNIPMCIAKE